MSRFPNRSIRFVAIVAAILLAGTEAHAVGLDGASVTVGVYTTFPGTLTLVSNSPTAIVAPALEFPVGSVIATATRNVIPLSIDLSTGTIDLHYPSGANATPTTFNGYHFDFTGLLSDITGVTVDPLSTLSPAGLSYTANSVFVNVQGLAIPAGADIILDVTTANVPEPETYEFLLGGFGAIGLMARHRRRDSPRG
jgi:hypothetical protein